MKRMHAMNIQGQTNVTSLRMAAGAANGIGSELGRFVVTTMELPWQVARERIGGAPAAVHMVDSMEMSEVERQIEALPPCDSVVAIGGGRAIDFGKMMAWRRGIRLVSIPSVLSVDAFVTPKAGLRIGHRVEYVGDSSPDPLVIDFDLLRCAPRELNVAGAGDLLSIHTAAYDWELAERAGRSEYPYDAAAVAQARAICRDTCLLTDAIRQCTDDGLRAIVEGYMRVNTICLPAGHYRVEEGSEHFLFYELEERLQRPFIHGQIVALGIYVMSRLQNNEHAWIVKQMQTMGLDYRPQSLDIRQADLRQSLAALPDYVRQSERWYSVIDEAQLSHAWIDEVCNDLYAEGTD